MIWGLSLYKLVYAPQQKKRRRMPRTQKGFLAPKVPVTQIVAALPKKVYVSIDLDVLDPSLMPATGTPEPGGIGWYDILTLLKAVAKERQILGFDVMELAPVPG